MSLPTRGPCSGSDSAMDCLLNSSRLDRIWSRSDCLLARGSSRCRAVTDAWDGPALTVVRRGVMERAVALEVTARIERADLTIIMVLLEIMKLLPPADKTTAYCLHNVEGDV
jgi:hypothetical protein